MKDFLGHVVPAIVQQWVSCPLTTLETSFPIITCDKEVFIPIHLHQFSSTLRFEYGVC